MMAATFTDAEQRAYAAMQLRAQTDAPYLTAALMNLRPVRSPGLGTFAVDGGWRMYVDPAQFTVWSVTEQAAVLLHEVSHLLRDHHGRAKALGVSDHTLWNVAGDATINDDLLDMGVALPSGITSEALGVDRGLTVEQVYTLLRDSQDSDGQGSAGQDSGGQDSAGQGGGQDAADGTAGAGQGDGPGGGQGAADDATGAGQGDGPGGGQGAADDATGAGTGGWDGGCGSGAGGMTAPAELAADDPAHAPLTEVEAEALQQAVADAIVRFPTSGTGCGSVPAGWSRWAEQVLTPSRIPWQTLLNRSLRRALTVVAGRYDRSYRRPSRRNPPGVVLPGNVRPQPSLATIIDTSGSMSDDDVAAALAEVNTIVRQAGLRGRDHRVLTVDAYTHGDPQPVTDARKLRISGGGGTDMRVGIAAAEALTPRVNVCLVLTDGYTPWPDVRTRTDLHLIIGLIGPDESLERLADSCPEWSTVVRIPTDLDEAC